MASRSLNKAQLIGNLTRDPEMRYTASGTAVTSFAVATNRTYTDSSGKTVESAEFTNIVAWAKLAEICSQLLKKGMKVFIEGRLQTSKWDDKETGKTVYKTEVVAADMIILSPSGAGRGDRPETARAETPAEPLATSEDVVDLDLDDLDLGAETPAKSDSKDRDSDSGADTGKNDEKKDTKRDAEKSEKPEDSEKAGDNDPPF
ncbi:hypothetical protein A2982_02880 [candidate division WWE3 bacterium RIFCSPLOWO2_01_FULL_39_13]|uniref:Single-stranded DNA-binding protein n=1 Tax=candidate division WWE3 bacterium RIFCSPLOWO2_01_FULL_39_13 TaxID=1802624 RepID=A0A1F4V2Q8_UNCKA|nr:MAG: hypothetical protein A2982_02880 [candidate division WWE3 bacterium RIFCSPLOWO2_01_FULL_39_13]